MPDDSPPKTHPPQPAGDAPSRDAVPHDPLSRREIWTRATPVLVAVAVPVLLFLVLPPLSKSGLWDPYELNVADLSRRIALNLYHATNLALDGADNTLPHLNDLGRPQLPFSSIAVGFKLFGLHEWAGRLPLALWGIVGVMATYAFVARLFDRRTGVYASIALSSMPLYFVQARSMIGDVCTMAGLALAFGGLAVSVFDRQPREGASAHGASAGDDVFPTTLKARLPWLIMGIVGLAVGFESRGAMIGLAVPLLGVGLGWGTARVSAGRRDKDVLGDTVAGVSLLAGILVSALALRSMADTGKDMDLWLGFVPHFPAKYPTFDDYVAAIGHSMAPWSAFVPFAFGRLLLTPPVPSGSPSTTERESVARVTVLVGATVAFVAHAYLIARTDLIAFSGPALCAVACAIAIRDFERGARASIAVGLGTLVLAAVLHHDFHELPEKAYQAFGIASASFPEGFKDTALDLWWIVLGGFAVCAFLTWAERDPERTPFAPASYLAVWRSLREVYDGALAFVYVAAVAGASLAGIAVFAGMKMNAHWMPQFSAAMRDYVLNAWWVLAFVPLGLVFGLLFLCDLWLWSFGRSRPLSLHSATRGFEPFEELFAHIRPREAAAAPAEEEIWITALVLAPLLLLAVPAAAFVIGRSAGLKTYVAIPLAVPSGLVVFLVMGIVGDLLRHRAGGLAVGGGVVGFILCFFYYPALANQLSPKEVFEGYRHACPDGPLALLGVGGRTSAYYAGGQPQTLTDPTGAYQWLAADNGQRRCLALKAEELPKINQLWRQHSDPRMNLPIVDARSSQILLAASSLAPGAKNENPLGDLVLTAPPHPSRTIEANLDDKLQVLGIDVVDESGHIVDAVSAGRTYFLKTYYRVLAPVTTEWEAFIHIDGFHRRHNGDHKPMNGKYPLSLWLPGDLLVDDHEFKLEPNFTPGTYDIYFGLFVGDTRIKVLSGPNDGDNRINGGHLRVQ